MYRAVSRGTIRFNPFEEMKYEVVEHKPRLLNKDDVSRFLAFPFQDKGAELNRGMFLFSVFTSLASVDLWGLRAPQVETNGEGEWYIHEVRQEIEVENLISLYPIAGQILALYTKAENRGDYKIFPGTMSN